jgi:hypothetical protein
MSVAMAKLFGALFLCAVLMSLKFSNEYLKLYGGVFLSRSASRTQELYLRRKGAQRNFTLLPNDFHLVDLELVREIEMKKSSNRTSEPSEVEGSDYKIKMGQTIAHASNSKEPIHLTLLVGKTKQTEDKTVANMETKTEEVLPWDSKTAEAV